VRTHFQKGVLLPTIQDERINRLRNSKNTQVSERVLRENAALRKQVEGLQQGSTVPARSVCGVLVRKGDIQTVVANSMHVFLSSLIGNEFGGVGELVAAGVAVATGTLIEEIFPEVQSEEDLDADEE